MDGAHTNIVAIERCIKSADRHLNPLEGFNGLSESLGDCRTARMHSDQYNIPCALIPLDYLVSDAGMRSAKIIGGEDACTQDIWATDILQSLESSGHRKTP
jgi:hypothetical protein